MSRLAAPLTPAKRSRDRRLDGASHGGSGLASSSQRVKTEVTGGVGQSGAAAAAKAAAGPMPGDDLPPVLAPPGRSAASACLPPCQMFHTHALVLKHACMGHACVVVSSMLVWCKCLTKMSALEKAFGPQSLSETQLETEAAALCHVPQQAESLHFHGSDNCTRTSLVRHSLVSSCSRLLTSQRWCKQQVTAGHVWPGRLVKRLLLCPPQAQVMLPESCWTAA